MIFLCCLFCCPCAAVKNKATGDFFLNSHGDYPETRSVIEKGLEWQYENKNYKDTIQTNGPLKNDVVIMVRTRYHFVFILNETFRLDLEK